MKKRRVLVITVDCPDCYTGFEPRILSFAQTRDAAITRSLALRDADWWAWRHNENEHKSASRAKIVFWEATRISLDKAFDLGLISSHGGRE